MIAKVVVPPFGSLSDTQQLVVKALEPRSKTTHELGDELKRNYSVINRALKDLGNKGWVEIDPLLSGGRANSWQLKQVPSDSIELRIDVGLSQESISFNRYFESIAKQLNTGRAPKLARDLEVFYKAIARLGYYAALEFNNKGEVTETMLLEARAAVQGFTKTLEDTYSIAQQLLKDERIWHAESLADGVMRKTDRYLTPGDMARYAKMISDAFDGDANEPTENEITDEETDSADD
jgi:hypothetical protein